MPVVRLTGIIGFSSPLRPRWTLTGIARSARPGVSVRNAAAVALAINSPGGSPVQSHLIFQRIRELAKEKNRRVIAFVEDAAASGGYMLCLRSRRDHRGPQFDRRFDRRGWRLVWLRQVAQRDRRRAPSLPAGEHKAALDPFLPENPEDVERLKQLQREIHGDFIALVKSRRGGTLRGSEGDLFSWGILDRQAGARFGPCRFRR